MIFSQVRCGSKGNVAPVTKKSHTVDKSIYFYLSCSLAHVMEEGFMDRPQSIQSESFQALYIL